MNGAGKSGREQDTFLPGRTSSTQRSADIKCPYFRTHGKEEVRCAGITEDTRIALRFLKHGALLQHERLFCCSRYWCCEICRMLDQIDEEDE